MLGSLLTVSASAGTPAAIGRAGFVARLVSDLAEGGADHECPDRFRPRYPDVRPGSALEGDLCLAIAAGLLNPAAQGRFGPERPVTLREVAGTLLGVAGLRRSWPGVSRLSALVRTGAVPASIAGADQPLTGDQVSVLLEALRGAAGRLPTASTAVKAPKRVRIPIFMFHQVVDLAPGSHGWANSIAPARLESFLDALAARRVQTLTFRDLAAIAEGKRPVPERAVLLTFDDGYRSHEREARRMLDQRGQKGNFAVVTGTLAHGHRHMKMDEVRDMARRGHQICGHSETHPDLTRLSEAALARELTRSRQELEEALLMPVDCLAYPYGRHDVRVLRAARAAGYRFARKVGGGAWVDLGRPFQLPGIAVPPTADGAYVAQWFPTRPPRPGAVGVSE